MIIDENTVHEVHPGLADTIYVPEEQPVEEVSVAPQPEQEQKEKKAEDTDSDRNFRELRRKTQRLEQEKEQYRARLEQYEAQKQHAKPVQEEEEIGIGDEDIVEGKTLKQFIKKQKALEAELKTFKAKSSEDIIESRIRARFPDYYSVVNSSSLETLAEEDPELAYTIQSSQDFYNKAVLAYKEIKRRGIMSAETYDSDKKRAQENAAKPRPTVSAAPQRGDSPMSKANAFAQGLTTELKASLWKEMQDSIKG
jgi:vacuolar-type H+-ATPase subunit I/STV1